VTDTTNSPDRSEDRDPDDPQDFDLDLDADGEAGIADDDAAPSDSDLFRQSEIAADYIEGLLDILDVDGDIDELVQNGRPMVEVVGGRLNNLVGNRGATLEALQELSRLAIYRKPENHLDSCSTSVGSARRAARSSLPWPRTRPRR
jgi:spoIIIJ-associated protein